MQLNTLIGTSFPKARITWLKMSVVPRLRNPALGFYITPGIRVCGRMSLFVKLNGSIGVLLGIILLMDQTLLLLNTYWTVYTSVFCTRVKFLRNATFLQHSFLDLETLSLSQFSFLGSKIEYFQILELYL